MEILEKKENVLPGASLRACLSCISKIWKGAGPKFVLEECSNDREILYGDFLITVMFHLIETPQDTEIYKSIKNKQEKLQRNEYKESPEKSFVEEDEIDLDLDKLESDLDKILPLTEVEAESPVFDPLYVEPDIPLIPQPKKKSLDEVNCPPQLCVSFLVTVANQKGTPKELLSFEDDEKKKKEPNDNAGEEGDEETCIYSCLELFCDGRKAGPVPGSSFMDQGPFGKRRIGGFEWRLVEEGEKSPLDDIRFVSATTFRHRYTDCVFDRNDCIERCLILSSIDMPFPRMLVETNVDYLANFLMLGLVVPDLMSEELRACIDARDLRGSTVHYNIPFHEQKAKDINPLKLKKDVSMAKKPHHLAYIGLLRQFLDEAGRKCMVEDSKEMDVIYDPNDLAKAAKKWGKLSKAAAIGAAIGGGVGVCIPIPGLFFLISFAGSIAGRWIAGKFVTDDGVELEDVVPIVGLRHENDDEALVEVVQDFDEDAPQIEAIWNKYTKKYFKKNQQLTADAEFIEKEQKIETEKGVPTAGGQGENWFYRTFWGPSTTTTAATTTATTTITTVTAKKEEIGKEGLQPMEMPKPELLRIEDVVVVTEQKIEPPSFEPSDPKPKDLLNFPEAEKEGAQEGSLIDLEETKNMASLIDLGEVKNVKGGGGSLIDLGEEMKDEKKEKSLIDF